MLWRKLLPLPAGPHPNEDALKASGKRLLCGTAAFFKLPRAVVLYEKPSKPHAQHCSRRFCTVLNELRALHPTDVAFPSSKKPVSRPGPLAHAEDVSDLFFGTHPRSCLSTRRASAACTTPSRTCGWGCAGRTSSSPGADWALG